MQVTHGLIIYDAGACFDSTLTTRGHSLGCLAGTPSLRISAETLLVGKGNWPRTTAQIKSKPWPVMPLFPAKDI